MKNLNSFLTEKMSDSQKQEMAVRNVAPTDIKKGDWVRVNMEAHYTKVMGIVSTKKTEDAGYVIGPVKSIRKTKKGRKMIVKIEQAKNHYGANQIVYADDMPYFMTVEKIENPS